MRRKKTDPADAELPPEVIQQKLEYFCAYRERCRQEVVDKLYQLKISPEEHDVYLRYLEDNNFLNEVRFAFAFARGKNAIKKWGKQKIQLELKARKIHPSVIANALQQIDEGMYDLKLEDILMKKQQTLKEADERKRRYKLWAFAVQKGYEPDRVHEVLNRIFADNK